MLMKLEISLCSDFGLIPSNQMFVVAVYRMFKSCLFENISLFIQTLNSSSNPARHQHCSDLALRLS